MDCQDEKIIKNLIYILVQLSISHLLLIKTLHNVVKREWWILHFEIGEEIEKISFLIIRHSYIFLISFLYIKQQIITLFIC
jgi:hypothetical protein